MEPNGIAVGPTHTALYVTNSPDAFILGTMPLDKTAGSPGINLRAACGPLGVGLANGIKVGDVGRAWAAEHDVGGRAL
ncbi:hypothetical protein VP1G_11134 [Cytospora mali]|uniref:Uncharacterized protein n=1 Tax=Cytospora mali TaxID=578113 RepID=A0A194V763_CYTMA|nr:hypothetical protein VP1G_11134 [Valsa mali var. pyri (nom. inval.)]